MQDILIPTDFSPAAQNAVDYAFSLFKGELCRFHFLNTYTPDFIHSRVLALAQNGGLDDDPMQSASENGLDTLVSDLEARYPDAGHEFRTVSSFNLLTGEIRDQLEVHGIDLVVSGTTGASGLKEVFLGSNTVRILKAVTHTPVLVVPREFTWKKPAKIGLVTDLVSPYTARQVETILFFAQQLRARVQVMHIGTQGGLSAFQELHRHQLFLELERLGPDMHWRWPQASKAATIEQYLLEEQVDLLVMIRNDHLLVEEWVREPVVRKVAFHTRVPMLVLPPA